MALTISEVARAAGYSTSRIRFYERAGVLPAAERVAGQRRYDADAVHTLRTIATLQSAGLTLDEVKVVLASGDDDAGRAQLRALGELKLGQLRRSLADIAASIAMIEHGIDCSCQPGGDERPGPEDSCLVDMERIRDEALLDARHHDLLGGVRGDPGRRR